jgi:hypothetical protein
VPPELSDAEACFTEPVAAACRILEQGLLPGHALTPLFRDTTSSTNNTSSSGGSDGSGAQEASLHQPQQPGTEGSACSQAGQAGSSVGSSSRRIGVVGDGRLGLLIAQVLALAAPGRTPGGPGNERVVGKMAGASPSPRQSLAPEVLGRRQGLLAVM